MTIAEVLIRDGESLDYEYDFGDSWEHRIELAGIVSEGSASPAARLVDGAERGPWEDSGGYGGYAEKAAILADPSHPEHDEIQAWVTGAAGPWGGAPDAFDHDAIGKANAGLAYRFTPEGATAGWHPELAGVLARMYPGAQAEFVAYLASNDVGQPPFVSAEVAESVRPYVWLLDQVGSDGLRLTQAGWLPPALVQAAMTDLDWTERWIGSFTRESDTLPVRDLRDSATRLGLIRKVKGSLQLAPAGRRLRTDPAGLWIHLAQRWLRAERAGVERDTAVLLAVELAVSTHRTRGDVMESVAYGLGALGWADADGYSSPTPEDAWRLVVRVHDVLVALRLTDPFSSDPDAPQFSDGAGSFARHALAAPRSRSESPSTTG